MMNIYKINYRIVIRRGLSQDQQVFIERLRVMHQEGYSISREAFATRWPGMPSFFDALEKLGYILKVGVV